MRAFGAAASSLERLSRARATHASITPFFVACVRGARQNTRMRAELHADKALLRRHLLSPLSAARVVRTPPPRILLMNTSLAVPPAPAWRRKYPCVRRSSAYSNAASFPFPSPALHLLSSTSGPRRAHIHTSHHSSTCLQAWCARARCLRAVAALAPPRSLTHLSPGNSAALLRTCTASWHTHHKHNHWEASLTPRCARCDHLIAQNSRLAPSLASYHTAHAQTPPPSCSLSHTHPAGSCSSSRASPGSFAAQATSPMHPGAHIPISEGESRTSRGGRMARGGSTRARGRCM